MTNWLTQPTAWTDQDGNSPPACWGGSKYVVVNTRTTLSLNASVANGDTFGATFVAANSSGVSAFDITGPLPDNNGNNQEDVTATPVDLSWALSSGMTGIQLIIDPGFGCSSDTVTITPPTPVVPMCDEYGRVTRAFVSGYQRARIHRSHLIRGEQRCLCAEFSGAISPSRSIVSVQWMCQQPYAVVMSNARIVGTECAVDINAQAATWCWIKCLATLDNGEVYTQLFYVSIRSAPYFVGELFPTMQGPTILTAQAS